MTLLTYNSYAGNATRKSTLDSAYNSAYTEHKKGESKLIKVVDKATGEYITFDYTDWIDFANQFDELNQKIKALERAKKKFIEEIKIAIGDEKTLEIGNGWRFERQQRHYLNYDPSTLRRWLDEDQLSLVLKPDKKQIDLLLGEWASDGAITTEAKANITNNMIAERDSVSAITLVKLKRV